MARRVRVVIADDEPPARALLATLLASLDDVVIAAEAESGTAAVAAIEREKPDLALLDVEMPDLDGLAVLHALRARKLRPFPLVAFVTAHPRYAVRAFEMSAIDYLLKPVDRARLEETMSRAREWAEHLDVAADAIGSPLAPPGAEPQTPRPYLDRIPVRRRDTIVIVPVSQIASVTADGELLHLTTLTGETHTIAYPLKDLEARLDPARFLKLGRGTLANVDLIVRLEVVPGGTHIAVLTTGQRLPVSRLQSRILRHRFLRL